PLEGVRGEQSSLSKSARMNGTNPVTGWSELFRNLSPHPDCSFHSQSTLPLRGRVAATHATRDSMTLLKTWQENAMETFDYVIGAAGSAGCVLANRLGEDPSISICVREAGPRDWHPYIHLPAGFIKTFHMRSINWAYQQEVGPWTGGRSIYAPRGKTLGGSSSINGHIYNRGQRQDFDTWAQMGNRGCGYPGVLPDFKRMEGAVGEGAATLCGPQR